MRYLLLLVTLALLAGGCAARTAGLTIAGSTSLQPVAEVLAEEFSRRGGPRILVQGGGSSAGVQAVLSGTADMGALSRDLTGSETNQGLMAHIIAYDVLTLVVHPDNPVRVISLTQLRSVFDGSVTTWAALGGHNRRLYPISREAGSGSREAFRVIVGPIAPTAIVQGSSGAIRMAVMQNEGAIGYVSLGTARLGGVRALAVDGKIPGAAGYPLVRPLSLVSRGPLSEGAAAFLHFARSPAGQELLRQEGLLPAPAPAQPGQ